MPPGESSHPGGSEYVWQRGVEGILGQVTKLMNEFQFGPFHCIYAFFLMHIGPCTEVKEEEKCFIWLSEVSALYRRENCTK